MVWVPEIPCDWKLVCACTVTILSEETTLPEAGATWTIGKARRDTFSFPGGERIRKQIEEGVPQRRVGFEFLEKGAPARQHSKILDMDGKEVGEISSGGFSPVLGKNIAMGYVPKALAKAGTEVQVETRGKKDESRREENAIRQHDVLQTVTKSSYRRCILGCFYTSRK